MSQPPLYTSSKNNNFKDAIGTILRLPARLAMLPHYGVFKRTTEKPITDIMNSTTTSEAQTNILRWCRRKTNEANYVQVAGAVMFASIVSSLSWPLAATSHWSGPALWYTSILLALASIFSAAQQSLALPSQESIKAYTDAEVEEFKYSLSYGSGVASTATTRKPSWVTLFAWQAPIMLLGYSVASFVVGMCVVIVTPIAKEPAWDGSAKTVVFFFTIVIFIGISASITTMTIRRLKVE